MLKLPEDTQVYVCLEPTDMRKAMNGLSVMVAEQLSANPLSGDLFLFFNRRKDIVKILYWHQNGYVLHHKRLEKLRFILPLNEKSPSSLEISEVQLHGLLAGLDFTLMKKFPDIDYTQVF